MKILVVVNSSWNITNFRLELLDALKCSGADITVLSPPGPEEAHILESGFKFIPLYMDPKGLNPLKDIWTFILILYNILFIKPHVVLSFTIKPNIYSGLACRLTRSTFIPNVAGLGVAFGRGPLTKFSATFLYRLALKRAHLVFFQNSEDRSFLVNQGLVSIERTDVLPGSGVNVEKFASTASDDAAAGGGAPLRFAMICRLIADKGVREYVEAAKRVKNLFPGTEFILAGFVEPLHRRAILQKELKEWDLVGAVSYVGSVSDVRPLLARADCIVLPSYYKEGTPRILLEAGAMGRALITTDLPGCRDTVEDGVSGYLCEPRSIDSLVEAIMLYCSLSELERREMSKQSRQRISENFSVSIVIRKYLLAIENALSRDLNNTG